MTAIRPWLVRRSAFPFSALGAPLGVVHALSLEHADRLAALHFPRPFTVEPSRGGSELERAVSEIKPRRPFTPHHFSRRIRRSEDA